MDNHLQKTLANSLKISGIGVHSGENSIITLHPAEVNHGIVFIRSDIDSSNSIPVSGTYDNVIGTNMCTILGTSETNIVATVEHLIAALWSCHIDNCLIEVNSSEVPIMDGSSYEFIKKIQQVKKIEQNQFREYLKVIKPVKLEINDKFVELLPLDDGNGISVQMKIDFSHKCIGIQEIIFDEQVDSFEKEISKARTFGFIKDIDALQLKGLAKGASLSNAIGLTEDKIMNEEGLRYHDEFVRHKVLDCIGDMYLSGYRMICKINAYKSGHDMHNKVLKKLFSDNTSYIKVQL